MTCLAYTYEFDRIHWLEILFPSIKLSLKKKCSGALQKEIKKSTEMPQMSEKALYMQNGVLKISYSTNYASISEKR